MKRRMLFFLPIILFILLTSCGQTDNYTKKVRDIEYTVVSNDELPKDLRKAMEEKKENGFKLTYARGEDLYIAIGYGKKDTGGFSVQVQDVYLTSNAIMFRTQLLGPRGNEVVANGKSYPMLVIKMEYIDASVVFDS